MAEAPLINITDYSVDVVGFDPLLGYDGEGPVVCNITVQFTAERQPESDQFFRIRALFTFDPNGLPEGVQANAPYRARIALTGYFVSALGLPVSGDTLPAHLVENGLQILYGLSRGVIGMATATGENGKMVIPTVAFSDIVAKAPNIEPADPDEPSLQRTEVDLEEFRTAPKRAAARKRSDGRVLCPRVAPQ